MLGAAVVLVGVVALGALVLRERDRTTPITSPGVLPRPTPWPLDARLSKDGSDWTLDLEGEPSGSVLVAVEGVPLRLVTLDDRGRGTVSGLSLEGDPPALDLLPVSGRVTRVTAPAEVVPPTASPPPPTSTPTPSPRPTAIPPLPTATPAPPDAAAPGAPRDADGRIRVLPLSYVPAPLPSPRPTTRPGPPAPTPTPTTVDVSDDSPPLLHLVADAGSRIAITFDGSSSTDGTANLLDLLNDLELDVTLFVTGEFIEANPAVVRRALLAGHEIGNHSYSHPHLTSYASNQRHDLLPGVDREMLHDQLRRTEEAFRRATGRPMAPLWRAPYGEENRALRAWALELGYLHVRWSSLEGASLDSLDWVEDEHSSLYRDSHRMMQRLLRFPRLEGGIVLMHLATRRAEPPWGALPDFVSELRRRGLEPVRVSQLLQLSPTWRPWFERAADRHRRAFGPGLRAPRHPSDH